MPTLAIVTASTRPGRVGPALAAWAADAARRHGGFTVDSVDLAEVALPLLDEPAHPRLRQYVHAHTEAWSARVAAADAFVFVTPEYNYFPPPSLVNALDYLVHEWAYKPAGFVSYGGLSGGLRSVQAVKPLLGALKVVPLNEAVAVPFFSQHVADGVFTATEAHEKSARTMLDELVRWEAALRTLRA
jgi:NAD(P)H-dependent FMN reductase